MTKELLKNIQENIKKIYLESVKSIYLDKGKEFFADKPIKEMLKELEVEIDKDNNLKDKLVYYQDRFNLIAKNRDIEFIDIVPKNGALTRVVEEVVSRELIKKIVVIDNKRYWAFTLPKIKVKKLSDEEIVFSYVKEVFSKVGKEYFLGEVSLIIERLNKRIVQEEVVEMFKIAKETGKTTYSNYILYALNKLDKNKWYKNIKWIDKKNKLCFERIK